MASDSDAAGWVLVALLGLAVYSCSSSGNQDSEDGSSSYSLSYTDPDEGDQASYGDSDASYAPTDIDEREPFDEDAAREAAEQELASGTYQSDSMAYGCTQDCSGHEAGWQWRAQHGYSTPGYSESFDEGGRAFDEAVDDRVQEMRDDYEPGNDADY